MKRRAPRAVLITSAERSHEDQLRTRTVRYVAMMSIRIVCLVLAVVLVTLGPPLLWLWLTLCALGMIFIPWIAVVLANDRLPKERHRWHLPLRRSRTKALGREINSGALVLDRREERREEGRGEGERREL